MRIAELVQDVVSVLLLPLYFAVSGLKTNLTLLDNGTSWGICFITIAAACVGKDGKRGCWVIWDGYGRVMGRNGGRWNRGDPGHVQ